jgi:Asp-tRNA(Asn)/Glu-tRNA(Gln) amidotransferase A subunit family amidase
LAFHSNSPSKGSSLTCSGLWRRLSGSLKGSPAIAVACGFSRDCLPIRWQLIGRPFDEAPLPNPSHTNEHRAPRKNQYLGL